MAIAAAKADLSNYTLRLVADGRLALPVRLFRPTVDTRANLVTNACLLLFDQSLPTCC